MFLAADAGVHTAFLLFVSLSIFAQTLTGFDRRSGQHNALHGTALERIHRASHGQIRFASAGRANAKRDVVAGDVVHVNALPRRAGTQIGQLV